MLTLCSNQQQTDPSSLLVKRKHVKHPSRRYVRVVGLIHFTELGPHTVHDGLFIVQVTFEIQNQPVSNVTLLFMFGFQQEKLLNYMKVTINRALLMKRNFCDCNSPRISIKRVNIRESARPGLVLCVAVCQLCEPVFCVSVKQKKYQAYEKYFTFAQCDVRKFAAHYLVILLY